MALLTAAAPGAAQRPEDLRMPPITDLSECERGETDGDVTVCGRRRAPDRYRIPPELRQDRTNPVNPSWSARARDERETGRYDSQAVGPAGALRQSLETECRWRAERQQLAGHPPDCTRRVRSPGD